jgi:DNA ligase (NAD+)
MDMDMLSKLKFQVLDHREAYYAGRSKTSSGEYLWTDEEYDLKEDLLFRNLPPDDPMLSKIGADISSGWKKEAHEIPMGSQDKIHTEEEIFEFCKRASTDKGWILEHKIDGFSLACIHEGKKLKSGVTRGNGVIGESITSNVKNFRGMPNLLSFSKSVKSRAEGFISKENFAKIQEESGDSYENPRNAAAGISRRFDGKYSRYIQVLFYDVEANVPTELDKLRILEKLEYPVVPYYVCKTPEDIIKIYREYKARKRDALSYEIDGFVIKYNDLEVQRSLGVKKNRPTGQVALKFNAETCTTTLNNIEVSVGRTGKLAPLGILEPVKLMGSTITKATLHNFAEIRRLSVGLGDEVIIKRSGDVIPQIIDVAMSRMTLYPEPTKCPSCGSKLENDSVNLWCRERACRDKVVNRITYWLVKLDIKGFSKKFVEKLYDQEKIKSVGDLYKLTVDDFASIEGIGAKTVKSFFNALKNSSEMLLETFIIALGIPTCSDSSSGMLVSHFKTWDRICSLKPDDIVGIPGYAEKSAVSICEGIAEIKDMATELLEVITLRKKKTLLAGISVCVTGELLSMSRNDFKKLVVEQGGVFKSSVTEDLTYLITNDTSSGSSKNEKALKYGVNVITEKDFFKKVLGQDLVVASKEESEKPKIELESLF